MRTKRTPTIKKANLESPDVRYMNHTYGVLMDLHGFTVGTAMNDKALKCAEAAKLLKEIIEWGDEFDLSPAKQKTEGTPTKVAATKV